MKYSIESGFIATYIFPVQTLHLTSLNQLQALKLVQ